MLTRERYSREIVDCIFAMVTEELSALAHSCSSSSLSGTASSSFLLTDRATIKNADAVMLLLSLLTELPRRVAVYILQKLLQLTANRCTPPFSSTTPTDCLTTTIPSLPPHPYRITQES